MKINVALLLLELSYPQSIPFPLLLTSQDQATPFSSTTAPPTPWSIFQSKQTLPKPSSPSQVESNTTPLLLLECLCGALLPTTPVSGTAPPNSLSKPLLQNRQAFLVDVALRGVISNASIEEIEAEKSLIEEDAVSVFDAQIYFSRRLA
ncbi:hypothetical protein NC652_015112 [Populus alba x Populus x berolinensis]|nr:hypothetical protein NC652_015112 [Populus alba x Populus x berolinensis]